jgi:methyl-accepting chemotaxis protein
MKYRFLRRLSLRGKINLVVAVIFTAIVVLLTIYNVNLARETYLSQVKSQGKELATLYFDSLNTMMLTGSMEKRSILRDKMLNRDQVIEARIIRGEPVNKQFGPGFQDELPMDDLDLRALQGQESLVIKESANERIMTIVKPFKATKDTLGVDCLQCHEVEEGAVNGAVRISLSLSAVDRAVQKEMWETIIGSAGFLVLGLIFVNMMMKIWIINPLSILLDVVRRRVDGDTKVRATTVLEDEIGDLSNAFNIMSNTTDAAVRREREQMEKEHATAQELREKVDALLDVVNKVAEGDYNVEVPFEGQDTIGELARQLQIMIGFIRQSSEDKREALELLKRRVDNMLEVVSAASNGNLTGHLEELGDDEIGQLAKGFNGMIDSLNDLVSQVQNSGIQVTSSATSIAATAKQQEATAAEQAATTSQIVSTATEISTTARELVNTMDEVADVSVNTTQSAESGYEGLRKMQATMENVVGAASGIASKFEIINERAANINTVVTTITKVADQTNLLSLNAAIEAEKAGEYGYGFSVVAKEIRRLADQTAVATLDIEQMVKEMQSAVSSGVMSMEKFSDHVNYSVNDVQQVSAQLVKIIEEVQALTPRFDSVHEGMQFQAKGADQINQSMIQLNDAASQTVESLRDSNSVIDNLNKAARTLQKGISNFNIRRK